MSVRSFVYFFRAFAFTGLENVLPQSFFLRRLAGLPHTTWLLSLALLLGAVCSLLGLWCSRWLALAARSWPPGARLFPIVLGVMCTGSFDKLVTGHSSATYFVFVALTAFLLEALFNALDNGYVQRSGLEGTASHVRGATVLQLLGILFAPFYFSFFMTDVHWTFMVVTVLGLVFTAIAAGTFNPVVRVKTTFQSMSLTPFERRFLIYALCMFAATVMMASMTIVVIQNDYHLPHPVEWGGAIIGVTNAVGILTVLLFARRARVSPVSDTAGSRLVTRVLAPCAFMILICVLVILLRWSDTYGYLFFVSIFTGVSYGVFQNFSRLVASRRSLGSANAGLLTLYNSIASAGSLLAFLSLALAATLVSPSGYPYAALLMMAVYLAIGGVSVMGLTRGQPLAESHALP